MKRFISALALCSSLLVLLSLVLFPHVTAKNDPISKLLDLPAPPPPNPSVKKPSWARANYIYRNRGEKAPADDAPMEELIEYWGQQFRQPLRYSPKPSDKVRERLLDEMERDPKCVPSLMRQFNDDKHAAEIIKKIYDSEGTTGVFDKSTRKVIREWLTYNSPYFSEDLARIASRIRDTDEYITSQQSEVLALTRVDYDRARPIIDRLYGNGSLKTSRVLAKWALYAHALETDSISDIDRYRDELKAVVEDKTALPGMRDLAFDALVSEKEWPGRDEWYYSLLSDETLSDLRVQGVSYTGLTTLILYSPPEKYIAKMIELLKSNNSAVRTAAVKNLITQLESGGIDVVKALLPWLENPKWATDTGNARARLVSKLYEYEIPESVPGLIKVLEEKQSVPPYGSNTVVNAMANAANTMAAAANAASTAANSTSNRTNSANLAVGEELVDSYPYRSAAISALAFQKDARAVQPLRRVLPAVEIYERSSVVRAILACNGFTIAEQLDALDEAARGVRNEIEATEAAIAANYPTYAITSANAPAANWPRAPQPKPGPPTAAEIRALLGQQLMQSELISDALARATVDRIEALDKRDPQLATAYRRIVLNWQNGVINMLLLRDVKRGIADADTILKLLAQRKFLREKHSTDVFDVRTGTPTGVGIAACLLEDTGDYEAILDTGNAETKAALFACARLIRAPLSVDKVAANLTAKEPLLAKAAEAYLISEDSPQARSIVLSRHGGEAMILGATSSFAGGRDFAGNYMYMSALFMSIGNESFYNGWYGTPRDSDEIEKSEELLQEEVKRDTTLLGVYAYDRNFIRIYNDRVIYSWDEDDSRYWERPLSKSEFDEIKSYIATQRADELPPFLYCGGGYCISKELLMLGRNGGRRVFLAGNAEANSSPNEKNFFVGLDKYFDDLKREPAKLKYTLSREIPGLEIVLAREDLRVATVWGEGGDIRVAASETATREKVRKEIDALEDEETITSEDTEESEDEPSIYTKKADESDKRRYEGYAWYRINGDQIAGVVAQPPGVEFIPLRDGLSVPVDEEQWKARAAGFEIRTGDDGLYKVAAGRLTKLLSGNYSSPVVSPDGRFALVTKIDEDNGNKLVRVNLATRKETLIETEEYGNYYPVVFIPSLSRYLVEYNEYSDRDYYGGDPDDISINEVDVDYLGMVDLVSVKKLPIFGEMRPLAQQTFRPLQKAVRPGELWAALPDSAKNETLVGTLNTRTLAFKQVIRVPKIKFDSMQMWVDEPRKKLYFVYRGHLLSLPLPI